jgi:hypothetical protein
LQLGKINELFEAEFEGVDIIDIVGCCVVDVICIVFTPDVVHCHPEGQVTKHWE